MVDSYRGYGRLQGEHRASSGSAILRDVLDLLVDLKQTPAGLVIHDQITRLLVDCEAEQHKTELNYLDLVTVLLEAYSRNPSSENVMRITAKLILLRPVTHLTRATIDALREDLLSGEPALPEQDAGDHEFDNIMLGLNRWAEADKQRRPVEVPAPATTVESAGPPVEAPTQTTQNDSISEPAYASRTRAREKKMQQSTKQNLNSIIQMCLQIGG